MNKTAKFIAAATLATLGCSPIMAEKIYEGIGVIEKVYDGDTFTVRTEAGADWRPIKELGAKKGGGKKLRLNQVSKSFVVRLGGVDTPESVHPNPARNSEAGRSASNYAKSAYDGAVVRYSCWDVGKYGRFICSLETKHGDIGIDLLSKGHSQYVTCWGEHPIYHREYRAAAVKGVKSCRR